MGMLAGLASPRGLMYRRQDKNNIPSAYVYEGDAARNARKGETDDSCGV